MEKKQGTSRKVQARGIRRRAFEFSKERRMKALVWHGKEDVRHDTVTDPEMEQPGDASIKVTSCAI